MLRVIGMFQLKMKNKKKSGFTLIELVISFAIFMIILVPILSMVLSTVNINKKAEDKQQATAIAQDYIEKFKSKPQNPKSGSETKDGFIINYAISNAGSAMHSGSNDDKITDPDLNMNIDSDNNLYANGSLITKIDSSSIINLMNDNDDNEVKDKSINFIITCNSNSYANDQPIIRKSGNYSGNIKLINDSAADVTVNISNNCSEGTLKVNLLKENVSSGGFLPGEIKGNVKIITDTEGSSEAGGTSRLLKITVVVSKEGKTLSQTTAYTSIAD